MKSATLLYGATDPGSEYFSADLLWRTKFHVPDPLYFLAIEGKAFLFVSSLEFGRAKKEAQVDEVLLSGAGGITLFLQEQGVEQINIPHSLPFALGKKLEANFELAIQGDSLFSARARKTAWEIGEITKASAAVGEAIRRAREMLVHAEIKDAAIYWKGAPLTSELLRKEIDGTLYAAGYLAMDTIVAGGKEAADPHAKGTGPLPAHAPIVLDIFPRSMASRYFSDITRTLFKGDPSPEMRKMYEAVLRAQTEAIQKVKAGTDAHDLHEGVKKFFDREEYPTEASEKGVYGFIHGLGHGVGIEIHEMPHVGGSHYVLEAGNVITIEPGLYYPERRGAIPEGGIRIEDTLVVEEQGFRVLADIPKDLAWAIVP